MTMPKAATAAVVGVLALWTIGCGGGGSSSGPDSQSTLTVRLTDSPFSDAQAVLVTFSEVSAHATGGDFMPLAFAGGATSRTCDLKRLVGAEDVLGTGALPPAHYTGLRLTVSGGALYFDGGTSGAACADQIAAPAGRSAALTIPSGEVRLNREFDLASGSATTITLDFDGDQSIKLAGAQYIMTPVIGVVSVQ